MARVCCGPASMRSSDRPFALAVSTAIAAWEERRGALHGLGNPLARDCLIRQIVDSDRRRRYIEHFYERARLTERRTDPSGGFFNPYGAAVLHWRAGDSDEALWLVFLAVHFGWHPKARWRYAERIYGRLGHGHWNWASVATDTGAFRLWLAENVEAVKGAGPSGFGNHRKRESLSDAGTGEAVESYVKWIDPSRGHAAAFAAITDAASGNPPGEFELLYEAMRKVHRFGRLARFDYLTTASRLGLMTAVAGRPYLPESTGPLAGARLLFGEATPSRLEEQAIKFGDATVLPFAVLEDALCNWQKSPHAFKRFGR